MIFADKLMDLRKKNGWSQEELAEKLNVSRQAVSKWESAQSVPDMNRIIQLSELFGVSTDYLLKDEMEQAEASRETASDSLIRTVDMEEANAFLKTKEENSRRVALGVMLCILSPVGGGPAELVGEYGRRHRAGRADADDHPRGRDVCGVQSPDFPL